jgi:methionyl-tRNA formyltransferase
VIAIESARAVFAGTPEFAVPALEALTDAGVDVGLVLTQPDRRAGRGRQLAESPVKQFAAGRGLSIMQPEALHSEFKNRLPGERPDLLIVVAYGLILPQWMLDWPKIDSLNVHASLLPRWRGAAPIQTAILAGDRETGVSIMRMTRGLDRGPVYRKRATPIGRRETAGELHARLAVMGAELLIDTLPGILSATLEPAPQDETAACYAPKLEKRDALLDWSQTAVELERKVRAYNPWPVAETRTAQGDRLRVWSAEVGSSEADKPPGTVIGQSDRELVVATGSGLLRLMQIQPPGGRVMSAAAYLAAHDLRDAVFVGPE